MFKRADGRWCEKIYSNGKINYIYAPTQRELRKKLRDIEYVSTHGELFSEVAAEWKDEHFQKIAPNSRKNYNGAYNRAVQYLGDMRIGDIEREDLQNIIDIMSSQGFAKKTVATEILVLNLIFKYARIHDIINTNPCELIEAPKNLKKTKREMPSDEDISKILSNVQSDPFGLFPFFLYYTGCRFGEALALQGKDIDMESKKIHISKSIYYDNGPKIGKPKTESSTRDIPILDTLLVNLPKLKNEQYLFSHLPDRSEPYTNKRIFTQWKNYCERNSITCTPHQLRHGFATLLFDAGLTAKDAQPLLGHSTIEMTTDIYTHIRASRASNNIEKLNDYVNKA